MLPEKQEDRPSSKKGLISLIGIPVALVLFIFLAVDGRHHWDEPTYFYFGGYFSVREILEGVDEFPAKHTFYMSRILHILLTSGIVKLTGLGTAPLAVLMFIYLILLIGFSLVTYQILRELLPETPRQGIIMVVVATAFTPMYLYFAFKTLPEIPALFLAGVATLGLLRSMKGRAVFWFSISAISLAMMALLKVTMALMYVSCVVALVLHKSKDYSPAKLISHSVISGVGSLLIFYGALMGMGIALSDYLGTAWYLAQKQVPLASLILNTWLEGGIFFFLFPLAFFSRQRGAAFFFMTWFLVATMPFLFIFEHIEARYVASNLIAISGLLYCAMDASSPRVGTLWWRNRPLAIICGAVLVAAIIVSNRVALAIMPHEVRTDQFDRVLTRLDDLYGRNNYAILTPWPYTTFEYIRVAYPDREVYNVNSVNPKFMTQMDAIRAMEDRLYHGRNIRSLQELMALNTNLIYLGFEENFSVANLRQIVRGMPGINLEDQFEKVTFLKHISLSWMWHNPQLTFSEKIRDGHYVAYIVTPNL